MIKIPRWLWIGVVVIVVLVIAGVGVGSLWLNSFVHSDAFRHEVETRAGETIEGTVEIKQIDYSIFGGVNLDGLATRVVMDKGTVVSQVQKVKCSYSLRALLNREVRLDGLTLEKPQVVVIWQDGADIAMPKVPAPVEKSEVTPEQAQSGKTAPVRLILEAAKIEQGEVSLRDASGATLADLHGVDVSANTRGYFEGKEVSGTLKVAQISLAQLLQVTDFSTPFTYGNGALASGPFAVTVFAGKCTGSFKLDANGSRLEWNGTGIDLARTEQALLPKLKVKLSGSVAFQSTWRDIETGTLIGEGDAQVTAGKLVGVTLLRELADALQLKEMSDPDLARVTTHFQMLDGTMGFDKLVIQSTVFEMTGNGSIDPQGNLNADMVLILHADAMKRIPAVAQVAFTKASDGSGSIPFHLIGTIEDLHSDAITHLFINSNKVQQTLKKTFNDLFK